MARAERGPPRARARARAPHPGARADTRAGRATGDACIDVPRVYPGRGAPTLASARRRGAGEAARQCVSSRRRDGQLRSAEGAMHSRGAMHGQVKKRRRRDARAG